MILIIYLLLNFISAALIFFIQPLAAKTMLPILGGAPFVWTGCMVFFQTILLAGYVYAHGLNTYVKKKNAVFIHLILFVLAVLLTVPLDVKSLNSGTPPTTQQLQWLLRALLVTLGLPFFVISATSPLTQTWFANTKSKWQQRPYVLYAASNLGSFAGLFAYPLLFEPFLPSAVQAQFIDASLLILFLTIALAGFKLIRNYDAKEIDQTPLKPIKNSIRLSWVLYALVPSGLLYSVSTYISTDLVSVPLLWVIPLGIYILSFVIVFAEKLRFIGSYQLLHFAVAAVMIVLVHANFGTINFAVAAHFIALFIFCMVCHQKLYDNRPGNPRQLTVFYIFMSLGGVLGGLLNVFVAPHVFSTIAEYPILIILSLFVWVDRKKPNIHLILSLLCIVCVIASILATGEYQKYYIIAAIIISAFVQLFTCKEKPIIAILAIALMIVPIHKLIALNNGDDVIHVERNIFGVSKVSDDIKSNFRIFTHGTTNHGIQRLSGDKMVPLAYYYALKTYFDHLPHNLRTKPIAVVGEGAGTLACYAEKGQLVDMIEINQAVIDIANNYFTYIKDCPGDTKVHLGDGRIEMSKMEDGKYGVIILDAFSSDSIPAHLITLEAVSIYSKKLDHDGIMFFNISNRYINLRPVINAIADSLGMKKAFLTFDPTEEQEKDHAFPSEWFAITHKQEVLDQLLKSDAKWQVPDKADNTYLWRDDYSNIIRSIMW